ncbi:MAG: Gx transporter family protein [Clostridia bacterium]|nr:Gx transporter family protein [Clostridia bacterium]
MKQTPSSPAYRVAMTGILSAEAVALSFLESLIPAMPFLPPGAKLGLANIVVMFTAVSFGLPSTLTVIVVKSFFTLIARGFSAFFISLCGGLLSGVVMFALSRIVLRTDDRKDAGENRARFGYIGISAASAVAHNIGQLIAASIAAGTALLSYLPFLILFGLLFGTLTGTVLGAVTPLLRRQTAVFVSKNKNNKNKMKSKVKDQ